jgi:hypothetical protein
MVTLLFVSAFAAAPLGPAVADADRGRVSLSAHLTGVAPAARLANRGLRAEIKPLDGLAVWVDGTWRSGRAGQQKELGWDFGGGVRTHFLPDQLLGPVVAARYSHAGEWTVDGEAVLSPHRINHVRIGTGAVVGKDGIHTWAGPDFQLVWTDGNFDWHPSGWIGFQLQSGDLVDSSNGQLYVHLSADIHIGPYGGLSVGSGLSF